MADEPDVTDPLSQAIYHALWDAGVSFASAMVVPAVRKAVLEVPGVTYRTPRTTRWGVGYTDGQGTTHLIQAFANQQEAEADLARRRATNVGQHVHLVSVEVADA